MTERRDDRHPGPDIAAQILTTLQEVILIGQDLARVSSEQRLMVEQLVAVQKTLRGDGDGEQGILWRMRSLESSSKAMSEDVHELKLSLGARSTEDQKGRWSLAQALLTGILALIAAMLAALVTVLLRR